ncbi:Arc family DNA-binding protein [Cypionkella sp.]
MLRWPDGLRQAVAKAALDNNRSMNAEIITRLEASFAQQAQSGERAA